MWARHAPGWLLVSLMVLAAGCSQPPAPELAVETTEPDPAAVQANRTLTALETRLGVSVVPAIRGTVDDWYVLPGRAEPGGHLRAFRFALPEGALQDAVFAVGSQLHLELAPVDILPDSMQAWGLFAFSSDGSQATYVDGAWATPHEVDVMGPAGTVTVPEPLSLAPRFWSPSSDAWKPGSQIFLILAATSDLPADFGLALRILGRAPAANETPAATLESFVGARVGKAPLALVPSGQGTGLHLAGYHSETILSVRPDLSVVIRNTTRHGPVVVTERLPVPENAAVTARQTTFASSYEAEAGWSRTWGTFVGACAQGTWSATSHLHGQTFEARSLVLQHLCAAIYPLIAEVLVFGQTSYLHSAEGEGAADATFDLLVADTNALEETTFQHVGFGTTIRQLTGLPSLPIHDAQTGLAGNVPPGR